MYLLSPISFWLYHNFENAINLFLNLLTKRIMTVNILQSSLILLLVDGYYEINFQVRIKFNCQVLLKSFAFRWKRFEYYWHIYSFSRKLSIESTFPCNLSTIYVIGMGMAFMFLIISFGRMLRRDYSIVLNM